MHTHIPHEPQVCTRVLHVYYRYIHHMCAIDAHTSFMFHRYTNVSCIPHIYINTSYFHIHHKYIHHTHIWDTYISHTYRTHTADVHTQAHIYSSSPQTPASSWDAPVLGTKTQASLGLSPCAEEAKHKARAPLLSSCSWNPLEVTTGREEQSEIPAVPTTGDDASVGSQTLSYLKMQGSFWARDPLWPQQGPLRTRLYLCWAMATWVEVLVLGIWAIQPVLRWKWGHPGVTIKEALALRCCGCVYTTQRCSASLNAASWALFGLTWVVHLSFILLTAGPMGETWWREGQCIGALHSTDSRQHLKVPQAPQDQNNPN